MKRFWIAVVCVIVVMGGGSLLLARLARQVQGEGAGGSGARSGILRWQVAGSYDEERETDALALVMQGRRPLLRDVVLALSRASRDRHITGLLLDIRGLSADWAQVEELRDAVAAFASSGKPVTAYVAEGGEKEYALALGSRRVVMAPEGALFLLGVSAELTFLKGTLDKLGMRADYVHVGRYKSAPEQMTRETPSEANREMVEAIVDDHYGRLVAGLAAGRGVDAATAAAWIDTAIFDAHAALAAGLVDTVLTLEELGDTEFGDEDFVDLEAYAFGHRGAGSGPRVALVTVSGTIVTGESGSDGWSGHRCGSDTVVERIRRAADDDEVKAVVLRVDSPGGSALASDLIWSEVVRTREIKPVIVSMGGYAASGGYYVACGADSLFAEPGTLTGSIGVFAGKVALGGFYAKLGVHREFVARGRNALLFSDEAGFSDGQRAAMERSLGAFYDRFVGKVATGRRLPIDKAAGLAEGRVWTGAQARERGLVDGLGGLTRALDSARRMIGARPDAPLALVTYEPEPGILEQALARALRRSGARAAATASLLPSLPADAFTAVVPLLDGRPLALLPLRLDFD